VGVGFVNEQDVKEVDEEIEDKKNCHVKSDASFEELRETKRSAGKIEEKRELKVVLG
jgi:hypothetical protein